MIEVRQFYFPQALEKACNAEYFYEIVLKVYAFKLGVNISLNLDEYFILPIYFQLLLRLATAAMVPATTQVKINL